jgi:hypothetical protein
MRARVFVAFTCAQHYVWQYPLSTLRSSADDGGMRLRLVFNEVDGKQNRRATVTDVDGSKASLSAGAADMATTITKVCCSEWTVSQCMQDIDCAELYSLVYTMHSFYVARIIGVDPDFLNTINK